MIFTKMLKNLITINFFIFLIVFSSSSLLANSTEFDLWINDFKKKAINSGISKNVVDDVMSNARFLPKVINLIQGEVAERLKALVLKTSNGATRSWVRIPPSPPLYKKIFKYF